MFMEKSEYIDASLRYFRGEVSLAALIDDLEQRIPIDVAAVALPSDVRVMLISNHPAAHADLTLPAEHIAGLKGGNSRNFPSFWFPIVRQMMLMRALQRRFFTIAHDIGWSVAMQEMGHLLIRHEGNGRCQEIISKLRDDDSSIVIFPEGGVRNLETFRTGFFYIACELGIKHLAVCTFSPVLSLEGPNIFRVSNVRDMSQIMDSVVNFVNVQRDTIAGAIATI